MKNRGMRAGVVLLIALLLVPTSLITLRAESSENIVILVSDNPADLAIAIYLSVSINATVVVSSWGTFNEAVAVNVVAELPDKIIIIGGPIAVPEIYEEIFQKLGIPVERIGGRDRYETNELVLEWMLSKGVKVKPDKIALVHGLDLAALEEALDQVIEGKCLVLLVKEENLEEIAELVESLAPPAVEVVDSPMINVTSVQASIEGNVSISVQVTISHTIDVSMRERAKRALERAKEKLAEAIELANNLTAVDIELNQMIEMAESLLDKAAEHFINGEFEVTYKLSLEVIHLSNKIVHKVNLVISTGQEDLASSLEFKLELYKEMLHTIETSGANTTVAITIAREIELYIERKEYDKAQQLIAQLEQAVKQCISEGKRLEVQRTHGAHGESPVSPGPAPPWKPPGG